MGAYPLNPNSLIDEAVTLNKRARTLREEGWTVKLHATDDGARIWVEVSQSNSCDPPEPEAEK